MIIKKFAEQIKRFPDKIALKAGDRFLTYHELDEYADRIADEIISFDHQGEKDTAQGVALLFEHGIDMIVGVISVLKADWIYVPFDVSYPINRLAYMLENSGSLLILTNRLNLPLAGKLKKEARHNIEILNIENISRIHFGTRQARRLREADGDKPAYILYTSGSTGWPKGVMQTHRSVLYFIRNWVERFSITEEDHMTLLPVFSHDAAVMDIFVALLSGVCLYPYSIKIDPDGHGLYNFLKREKITIWHSVPSLFRYFGGTLPGVEHFDKIRWVLLGGEPVRSHDLELHKTFFPNASLGIIYGQTESSVNSICIISQVNTFNDISIGEPLDETEIFLVDKEGDLIEGLGVGEIVVASTYIARGYWQDEEKTKAVFINDDEGGRLYLTGDMGRYTGQGIIKIIGRKDFQVKIRGFRVETGEIETVLLKMVGIQQAAVVARDAESTAPYLCAFIAAAREMKVVELREFLAQQLPDYMIPTSFIQLDSMPFTQSGKLDKNALMIMKKEPLKLEVTYEAPHTELQKKVTEIWKEVLGLERIGIHENLFDLGGNSFDLVTINNKVSKFLDKKISMVKFFEYPTIDALARFLSPGKDEKNIIEENCGLKPGQPVEKSRETKIAVIGMAGRFPGARDIDEFWENLKNGIESISFLSDEDLKESGIEKDLVKHPAYVKVKGILEDIDFFDASFFNFAPRKAEMLEPQVRLFFECVWEALEHAGYDCYRYNDLIGIYAGNIPNYYWSAKTFFHSSSDTSSQMEAGLMNDFTTRISYQLNLTGPCITMRTACSTSLVAIHLACQGLLNRECDIALAGGVSVSFPYKSGYLYREGMTLSADGHIRAFDARATGTVFGDGMGCVVLKRLDEALKDGDCIHAVVLGSFINNDGARKLGYTAPSIDGQAHAIKSAQLAAGIEPGSIGFIETHGTGTNLGDPVEIEALKKVFGSKKKGFCALGAVKNNVGHLNAAAGVTGFIKTVLTLKHRLIPPNINFEFPNPGIELISSPFYINTNLVEWANEEYPLRAGVSSFGFGGTNAHVVLEESLYPSSQSIRQKDWRDVILSAPLAERDSQLLLLSAKTGSALDKMTQNLIGFLKSHPVINLADAAYTLQVGRHHFKYRRMLVCANIFEAIDILSSRDPGKLRSGVLKEETPGERDLGKIIPGDNVSWEELGMQWLKGAEVDWGKLYSKEKRFRIPLPVYPFERKRFWIDVDPYGIYRDKIAGISLSNQNESKPDMYVPVWKPSPLPVSQAGESSYVPCWLMFIDESDFTAQLVHQLEEEGKEVICVKAGNEFTKMNDCLYKIDPRRGNEYKVLVNNILSSGKMPDTIVHLWGITADMDVKLELDVAAIEKTQYNGFYSLLFLDQAIRNLDYQQTKSLQIKIVTNNMQKTPGEEFVYPGKATVLAPVEIFQQEYPNIQCCSIDISFPRPGTWQESRLREQLLRELKGEFSAPMIAYRGNDRLVKFFEPLPLSRSGGIPTRLRKGGVYMIIGKLEGIGFDIAQYLARTVTPKLILIGDNHCFQSKKGEGKVLEQAGATVQMFSVDTSSLSRMRQLLEKIEIGVGPVSAVIHCLKYPAGKDKIEKFSPEKVFNVMTREIHRVLVLREILKNSILDFWVSCSYLPQFIHFEEKMVANAASMFLDSLTHYQLYSSGQFPVSIRWNTRGGKDIGDVLGMILEQSFTQVIISDENPAVISERSPKTSSVSLYPRPELSSKYIPPISEMEIKLTEIWGEFFGFEQIGTRDDFSELGGDSLKVIILISKMQKELNVLVPIPEFFNRPNIQALAGYFQDNPQKNIYVSIKPAEEREYYPLALTQRRLYILQQADLENISYNIPGVYQMNIKIDSGKFQDIFKKMIRRQECFRTSFTIINGEPAQRIHQVVDADFAIEHYETAGKEGEIVDEIIKKFIRPFDLLRPPLLRVGLIKIAEEKYLLMTDMHHLISDGISVLVTIRDFWLLYDGAVLPELPVQYRDFSLWQLAGKDALKKQEEYWLKEFEGNTPVLQLPFDYTRPPVQSFEGSAIKFEIDTPHTQALKILAESENSTLFMVVLAVYTVLLSRLSGQEQIVVGTGVAGRNRDEIQELVGTFINTIPLKNFPAKVKTFREFLKEIREKTLLAFANQDYPFEDLVEKIAPIRDWRRNPLFDVFLMSLVMDRPIQNSSQSLLSLYSGVTSKYEYDIGVSKFDIGLLYWESPEKLAMMFEYCTRLFKRETIERFIAFFKDIVSAVATNKDIKLGEIEISHALLAAEEDVIPDEPGDFEF